MKKLFFFLMVLFGLPGLSFGQTDFIFSGKVTDCKTHEGVFSVTVKIVGSDGFQISMITDSAGNYSFTNCFKTGISYIINITVADSIGRGKGFKYGTCPVKYYEKEGYIASSERVKFVYSDTLKRSRHDFCLVPMIVDRVAPGFYFKKNSTEFSEIEWGPGDKQNADTCIDCFVSLLMAHKHLIIEIDGHSSADENNKNDLAKARAKKLSDLLVSKGIDPKRLVYKSYSDTRPYEFWDETGQHKLKKEKAMIYAKSRRVTLVALANDFDMPIAPAMKIKSTDDDSEE